MALTNKEACHSCKVGTVVFNRREGHMEVFKCDSCGWEAAGTFSPAADVARFEYELEPFRIRLASAVSGAREISVVRRLFPEQADSSISELKRQLCEGAILGIRSRRVAEGLQLEARAAGVELTLEQVEEREVL